MSGRRAKGDGGLTQRGDGRWQATLDVRTDSGAVKRLTLYGKTKAEAKKKLDNLRRDRDQQTLVLASMTVEQWLAHWLDQIAARSLKPQTLTGYRSTAKTWLIPHVGQHKLTALKPEHVRRLHDTMREAGKSEGTIRLAHAVLRRSLKDAVYDGKLVVSPAERVKPPSTTTATRACLTLEQASTVLSHTNDARWWLALFYGMRQGECLGLRWSDVDFDAKTITIAQTLQYGEDYKPIFGPPKSKSSRRTIPMLPLIEARMKLRAADGAEGLVFGGATPVDKAADQRAWKALLSDAGVPSVALHSARQTAASVMEAAGIPDRLVMQILGHSQVRITHGYQSAEVGRMRIALERIPGLLELD